METVGSKKDVYEGRAKHTSGGLTKKDLVKNKRGRVVSKAKHEQGLRMFPQTLGKSGSPFRKSMKKTPVKLSCSAA